MNTMDNAFVFLPGFLCDPLLWNDVRAQLSDFTNITTLDFKNCKNLDDMLDQIALVPHKKFHLVGFSMGGYIAQQFAVENPDRILSLSLVAVNVGALNERERSARLKMADTLARFHYRGMTPKEVQRYVHPTSMTNPHVVDTIIKMSAAYTSEMYINQMKATLDRKDVSSALNALEFPILMVAGQDDRVVPAHTLEDLQQKIPRSVLKTISECGHYIPLEKPIQLASVFKKFISTL